MSSVNPKMLAHDVAKGLMSITPASLKKYSAGELKTIINALNSAQREVRGKAIPPDNQTEIKEKNRHLQNLAHAITLVSGYAKQHHIQI